MLGVVDLLWLASLLGSDCCRKVQPVRYCRLTMRDVPSSSLFPKSEPAASAKKKMER